jgi:hypothetical protein
MDKTDNQNTDSRVAMDGEIGILARRRIEAGIIAPIYEAMREEIGEERAQAILDKAITKAAIEAGRTFAAKTPGGTNLRTFQELQDLWTQDDALVIEVTKATDEEFHYNVKRCRYAETYREMGLATSDTCCPATATASSAPATTRALRWSAPRR